MEKWSPEKIRAMIALYTEQNLTLREIGALFGITKQSVSLIFKDHQIKTRPQTVSPKFQEGQREAAQKRARRLAVLTPTKLRELYVGV